VVAPNSYASNTANTWPSAPFTPLGIGGSTGPSVRGASAERNEARRWLRASSTSESAVDPARSACAISVGVASIARSARASRPVAANRRPADRQGRHAPDGGERWMTPNCPTSCSTRASPNALALLPAGDG
jgi:hypothetical protein